MSAGHLGPKERGLFEKAAGHKTPLLNMIGNREFELSQELGQNIACATGKDGAQTHLALLHGIAYRAGVEGTKQQDKVSALYNNEMGPPNPALANYGQGAKPAEDVAQVAGKTNGAPVDDKPAQSRFPSPTPFGDGQA